MPSNLLQRGFLSLIVTQFFGAMNDNILKVVLTFMVIGGGVWQGQLGDGGQGVVTVCFTVPFLILSGIAGQIADRHSKRSVTLWVKIAEIPIAMVAAVGFYIENLWVVLTALIALTCQSAFFGPAKYGMIPELVDDSDLSRANGTINMMTNLAAIGGTLVAGNVSDTYAAGLHWMPGLILLMISFAGLASAIFMTPLKAVDRDLRYALNPFATYVQAIREMSKSKLLMVMMAWGYFYLLAGIALSILPEYYQVLDPTGELGITRFEASVLMGVLGVAIGLGCAVAGLISGHKIEPRLIPIGALGLTIFFALLAAVPPWVPDMRYLVRVGFSNVAMFVIGAGVFAGFYIIPLQALLQKLSPGDERGRFLGTANAVSFAFLTVAGILVAVVLGQFADRQKIFYLSSFLMATGSIFFLWKLGGIRAFFKNYKPIGSGSLENEAESDQL